MRRVKRGPSGPPPGRPEVKTPPRIYVHAEPGPLPCKVRVVGWLPVRLNQLLNARHWSIAGRLKKADKVVVAAAFANTPKAVRKRRVGLKITLGPRQRAGDPDCYFKSLADALVAAEMLVDDNRQGVEWLPVEFDRGPEPATTITLEDI